MRAGLNEMRSLAVRMYPTVRDETFFESCGVADLIATCYGVLPVQLQMPSCQKNPRKTTGQFCVLLCKVISSSRVKRAQTRAHK